jgi:L-amino acid N-acyltransferase YncA
VNPLIGELTAADWPAVQRIYAEGIAGGNATFESEVPPWPVWDGKHLAGCRLVARFPAGEGMSGGSPEGHRPGEVVGWAALAPVSTRAVYRGVAEVSVYVATFAQGQGVGRALLRRLIEAAESAGVWTLQASIFPENEASLRLHLGCGFRFVGRRERIAQMAGRWRDTLLLERRSQVVGK